MPFTEFVTAVRVCSGGRQDYCTMIISAVIYCLETDTSMSFGQLFRVIYKIVLFFASSFVIKKSLEFLLYFMSVSNYGFI